MTHALAMSGFDAHVFRLAMPHCGFIPDALALAVVYAWNPFRSWQSKNCCRWAAHPG